VAPIGIFSRDSRARGHGESGQRAYYNDLTAETPTGLRDRAPGWGSGRSPPEAENLEAFVRLKEGPKQYFDYIYG